MTKRNKFNPGDRVRMTDNSLAIVIDRLAEESHYYIVDSPIYGICDRSAGELRKLKKDNEQVVPMTKCKLNHMKDLIYKINNESNSDKAQGMLEVLNAVYDTQYKLVEGKVVYNGIDIGSLMSRLDPVIEGN